MRRLCSLSRRDCAPGGVSLGRSWHGDLHSLRRVGPLPREELTQQMVEEELQQLPGGLEGEHNDN